MRALLAPALLASLALGACTTMGPGLDPTPDRAPAFVALAASTDLYEIESSRLALQRSQAPMVRMHAEMMIRDHTNTSNQLRSVAASAGLSVPTQMLPMHLSMLDALSRSGDFTLAYRQQQTTSHQRALALMENFARRGDVPQLRGLAAATVPVVRGHLDHLRMR